MNAIFDRHCARLLDRLANLRDARTLAIIEGVTAGCGYNAIAIERTTAWIEFRAFDVFTPSRTRSALVDELVWA